MLMLFQCGRAKYATKQAHNCNRTVKLGLKTCGGVWPKHIFYIFYGILLKLCLLLRAYATVRGDVANDCCDTHQQPGLKALETRYSGNLRACIRAYHDGIIIAISKALSSPSARSWTIDILMHLGANDQSEQIP
jgi:hypothetical protein